MTKRREPTETELVAALEEGKLSTSRKAGQEMRMAREAARRYLRKDARINIRLSASDLELLKRKAAEEGMPYQTLVASVLHKLVTGRLAGAR
ncbi:MAG: antitoxin [Nitrospirae bacterium]|nr:antitoxin [Nitrospirota bacterium]